MFGKNPILGKEYKNGGSSLHVVKGSPFLTIQGEGPYSGHRAYFLRLHGCPLRCTFCDTQFSDPDDPTYSLSELTEKLTAPGTPSLIVITGGEPLRQDIRPLCIALRHAGKIVQIETAGVYWLNGLEKMAEIVCSPKTPKIHPKVFEYASTFKYVIDCQQQFDKFIPITATQPGTNPQKLAAPRDGAMVYLSPMDCYDAARNTANRSKVAELAMKYDCIAGLQLHKFMNLD